MLKLEAPGQWPRSGFVRTRLRKHGANAKSPPRGQTTIIVPPCAFQIRCLVPCISAFKERLRLFHTEQGVYGIPQCRLLNMRGQVRAFTRELESQGFAALAATSAFGTRMRQRVISSIAVHPWFDARTAKRQGAGAMAHLIILLLACHLARATVPASHRYVCELVTGFPTTRCSAFL